MLPILTRLLSPDEYGRLDLLSTLASAGISGLLVGLDTASLRLAVDPGTSSAGRRKVVGAWAVLASLIVAGPATVLVIYRQPVSEMLFGGSQWSLAVAAVGITIVVGTWNVLGLTLLRIKGSPGRYAAISAGTLVLNAALALVALLVWRRDATAVLAALAVAWAVGAGVAVAAAGRQMLGRPTTADIRRLLALALPLAPAVAATWAGEFANRAIVFSVAGSEALAYLSVGLRFASLVGLAVVGYQLAWQPQAYAAGTSPTARATTGLTGRRIIVTVAACTVVIASLAPELVPLVSGTGYEPAVPLVGLASLVQLATAISLVCSMPSALARRMRDLGVAGVAGVGASILLNFALTPAAGPAGSLVALALGQLVGAGVAWRLGSRHVNLCIPWQRMSVVVVVATVAVGLPVALGQHELGVRLAGIVATAATIAWEGSIRRGAPTGTQRTTKCEDDPNA